MQSRMCLNVFTVITVEYDTINATCTIEEEILNLTPFDVLQQMVSRQLQYVVCLNMDDMVFDVLSVQRVMPVQYNTVPIFSNPFHRMKYWAEISSTYSSK